jgi:hypothetical protein
MYTLIIIASIGLGIATILFFLKLIELGLGMPGWYKTVRARVDYGIESSLHMTHSTYRSFLSEIKEALGRTPHLIVHLAIVMRDKLKVYFAKYIDEVKGKKPIVEKKSSSDFLQAVTDYKKDNSVELGQVTEKPEEKVEEKGEK